MSLTDALSPISESFSLKDHIYGVLREAILKMNIYQPEVDLRLDERKLAEQLAVSRTPIREALARLAQEGLVVIIPRKGNAASPSRNMSCIRSCNEARPCST